MFAEFWSLSLILSYSLFPGPWHPHRFSQSSGWFPEQCGSWELSVLQHPAEDSGHPLHDAGCVFLLWHGQWFPPLWPGLTHLHTLHITHQKVRHTGPLNQFNGTVDIKMNIFSWFASHVNPHVYAFLQMNTKVFRKIFSVSPYNAN